MWMHLGTWGSGGLGVLGEWLGSKTLERFSNLNDSMIQDKAALNSDNSTSEDHVLHYLGVMHHLWPLWGTTGSKSISMEFVSDSEKSQRMWSQHTKNKWTRGCSFHAGVSNSYLTQVVPLPKAQSTHCSLVVHFQQYNFLHDFREKLAAHLATQDPVLRSASR